MDEYLSKQRVMEVENINENQIIAEETKMINILYEGIFTEFLSIY
jgi:hypothetical protein